MEKKTEKVLITLGLNLLFIAALWVGSGWSKQYISIAANPVGMAWYTMAAGMVEVINKNFPDIHTSVEATKGGVHNLLLLQSKEVELAFTSPDLAYQAYRGIGRFEGKKAPILGMFANQVAYQQIVALKSSGITKAADLKGKKVGVGPPGSLSIVDNRKFLEAHGISMDDIKPFRDTLPELVDKMKDNHVDAIMWFGGIPMGPLVDVAHSREVIWIHAEEAAFRKLEKTDPFYFMSEIPAGLYKGQTEAVKTLAYRHIFVSRSDMSEDLIYKIMKAVFGNLEYLGSIYMGWKVTSLETALQSMAIMPLHPGALKYYREAKQPHLNDFLKKTSGL